MTFTGSENSISIRPNKVSISALITEGGNVSIISGIINLNSGV